MYGRGKLRSEFRSRWVDAEFYKLTNYDERTLVYKENSNLYSCESCGFGSNVQTNFCPNCGKAMNDEAMKILEYRLERIESKHEL